MNPLHRAAAEAVEVLGTIGRGDIGPALAVRARELEARIKKLLSKPKRRETKVRAPGKSKAERREATDAVTAVLTPREMAISTLKALGEETESLYWPFSLPSSPRAQEAK